MTRSRYFGFALAGLVAACVWSCSGSGGSGGGTAVEAGNADLVAVESGRLVDIYGLGGDGNKYSPLGLEDSVIGTDIIDGVTKVTRVKSFDPEKPGVTTLDVEFRFEGVNPETGQEKLVINLPLYIDPAQVSGTPDNPEFLDALDMLDDNLKNLGKGYYGQDTSAKPFSVAPRNGAIRLTFSRDLGLPENYFIVKDDQGQVTGLANTRALQLLEILGDPNDGNIEGDFKIIPARIKDKGNVLVIDPVILGAEGPTFGVPNNAQGLPASSGQVGANIRIAMPLEGAIRMAGLRENNANLLSLDAYGVEAVIRDFRAANTADNDPSIANGFLNDPIPPRLVGESLISLLDVKADPANPGSRYRLVKIYQEAMNHTEKYLPHKAGLFSPVEIDPFDIIKQTILPQGTGQAKKVIQAEVVGDIQKLDLHADDPKYPGQKLVHYWVKVKMASDLDFELNRDQFGNPLATEVIQVTTYEATTQVETAAGGYEAMPKDDARYFLTFSPPAPDPQYPTDNISPFASAIVRFTKPVDMNTMGAFDTLILSVQDTGSNEDITDTILDPQKGTPGLISSRIYDEDGAQRVIRSQPPLGFYHDSLLNGSPKAPWIPADYRATGTNPPDPTDLFYLYLVAGSSGVKDLSGNPIYLDSGARTWFKVDFTVRADASDNLVANICRRFMAADEDAYNSRNGEAVKDWFGAIVLVGPGKAMGRPGVRVSKYLDNLNQIPEPTDPNNNDLRYCGFSDEIYYSTSTFALGSGIQNPINPLGCRLQTSWRETDLSLSRVNPNDFNLDVEQFFWPPFTGQAIIWDVVDKTSLYLYVGERRPSTCHDEWGALPVYPSSGLSSTFKTNYLDSADYDRYAAYEEETFEIRSSLAVFEPNDKIKYLPLPQFAAPYMTWRDERDLRLGGGSTERVLSPWISKKGDPITTQEASFDGGQANRLPTIALPLLADFYFYPDDPTVNGAANGFNGWQCSIGSQSSYTPSFRVYSGGGYRSPGQLANPPGPKDPVDPSAESVASGGYTLTGTTTRPGDNTIYWIRTDFLKRISVMTYGFVDFHRPNKCADPNNGLITDPRLINLPANARPQVMDLVFEPSLSQLPQGTKILPQFRAAQTDIKNGDGLLHPLVACEAHIYEDWFTGVSDYLDNPNNMFDATKLRKVTGQLMNPATIKFFNWRLIFEANVDVTPAVSPELESLGFSVRLVR